MVSKRAMVRIAEEADSDVWGPLHNFLTAEQAQKTKDYDWTKPDEYGISHKIYPSAIKTIDTCPKKLVEVTVHTPGYFMLNSLEAMENGTIAHQMVEEVLGRIPNYNLRPDYSTYEELYPEWAAMLRKKYKEIYPEVPIYDPISGTSLRIDIVKATKLIIDLKTLNVPDIKVDNEGDIKSGIWAEEKIKLGKFKPDHKLQVATYLYFWNLFRLSPEPILHGKLAYLNCSIPKNDGPYFETDKFILTNQMSSMIAELYMQIGHHRQSWIIGNKLECEYKYCKEHAGKADKK